MRATAAAAGLLLAILTAACSPVPPVDKAVEWEPSRIGISPTTDLGPALASRPPLGKFSLRFYQRLNAHPRIAPLTRVDVWELRHHPRQYDVITIGPVSLRQYTGRKELLDHLSAADGLTRDKAEVLTNWVKTGGVLWIEFGVFLQGHEWIQNDTRTLPALPDLAGFTIFGLPTRSFVFAARRTGAFTIEPAIFPVRNEASHVAVADIKHLKLVQAELKTVYPIINAEHGEPLVRSGDQVYATVAPLQAGKIISSLPFERWDPETDGEKYRINLLEWLGGYQVPTFDPLLDVERAKD